ncbi:hypothetical protein [Butyrivibrio sp. CB08]|nr:hypothetical protein [Butyrivibrio sp. CB08]
MSKIKDFIIDSQINVVFAVTLAKDVAKYLREESRSEKLCLHL